MFKPKHTQIKDLYEKEPIDQIVTVKGWIRTVRAPTKVMFIQMYDGSHAKPLQLIYGDATNDLRKKIEPKAFVNACIVATGKIIKSPAKGQSIEMLVESGDIIGEIADPSKFLPSIKGLSLEAIRNNHDTRPMMRAYQSIYRIRSKLMQIVHEFFHKHDFHHLDPNVITSGDCEGGGDVFTITSLPLKNNTEIKIDFSKDMFEKQAFLTVSSQLQLEALCRGMSRVYTTNPSFRAEQSKTRRHLCCFTHLEWEIAFIDLDDLMDFSEDLVTHCIKSVLTECRDDLNELNSTVSKGIIAQLESFVKDHFERITYDSALEIIIKEKERVLKHFPELKEIPAYGDDLGSYCERYLCEIVYKKPIMVYNYPRDLKSFYMKQNDDGKTVACMDMLIPGTGELIGGSSREANYDKLQDVMKQRNISLEPLQWYIDLRKNGSCSSAGSGLGFDRLVSILTSVGGNIRDATPFPVAFQECFF